MPVSLPSPGGQDTISLLVMGVLLPDGFPSKETVILLIFLDRTESKARTEKAGFSTMTEKVTT